MNRPAPASPASGPRAREETSRLDRCRRPSRRARRHGPGVAGGAWRQRRHAAPHAVHFYGEGDHDDLNEVARRAGFLTRGHDDCTILETTMAVDEASFSPVSSMMQSWAAAFQLEYDGWECAVVTN